MSLGTLILRHLQICHVADDLRHYTCDALVSHHSYSGPKRTEKQVIGKSDIIFATCIDSAHSLLTQEHFDVIIIDEASRLTEQTAMTALVKGRDKAILIGDHAQPRPRVGREALTLGIDESLFEKLMTRHNTTKHLLDTQYRMHPSLCYFSSKQFYEDRLKTGVISSGRPLNPCGFPFPLARQPSKSKQPLEYTRAIFIECRTPEVLGQVSKENRGQAELCVTVCKRLVAPSTANTTGPPASTPKFVHQSIAILAPYDRQVDLLRSKVSEISSNIQVSSIEDFQDEEADIVVLVTVRCNEHHDIGPLGNGRLMNIALTSARVALIIIGNKETLAGGKAGQGCEDLWANILAWVTDVSIL